MKTRNQIVYEATYYNGGRLLTRSFYDRENAVKWLKSFYGGLKNIKVKEIEEK